MKSPYLLAVLRQLSHETFVSGSALAEGLGCSRATVNNTIREAQAAGMVIHAVHGRGYRLAGRQSWLDFARLDRDLAARDMVFRGFDSVASTNTHLMQWAQADAPHRALVAAEWQGEGRGRRGRSWLAGLGGGLLFSLLWRSGRTAAELSGLSLAVGVALVQGLHAQGLSEARVKWPNDILVNDAKLAGVLIELAGDMLGPSAAIIGVGVNVAGAGDLTRQVGQPVTDLDTHLGPVDRNTLLLSLAAHLDAGLARFEAGGFAAFQADWQQCHAHQNRTVRIHQAQGEPVEGRALGVDDQGALLLETGQGLRRFHSGEVSLRPVEVS
jgi:BirA family biotin operon repressor/biotin-[acetyl-CoA-carboxylase] ligase